MKQILTVKRSVVLFLALLMLISTFTLEAQAASTTYFNLEESNKTLVIPRGSGNVAFNPNSASYPTFKINGSCTKVQYRCQSPGPSDSGIIIFRFSKLKANGEVEDMKSFTFYVDYDIEATFYEEDLGYTLEAGTYKITKIYSNCPCVSVYLNFS